MKIPLSWISLYTPLTELLAKHDTKSLAHEYSTHTAEIDGIEEHFFDKVVVGKVLSCEKHPESKKLSIVEVDQGEYGKTTILTGALNIVEAKYVAVAMVGATLPGDFHIGERMMAGMMSRGMICGADEIGMSTEESTGIMILEETWDEQVLEKMLGRSFFDLTLPFPGKDGATYNYPLRDVTFEIDNKFITNRPDLFSVIGNAREFGAVFDLDFSVPVIPAEAGIQGIDSVTSTEWRNPQKLTTKVETKNCLSYHLMKMEWVAVGKSPWGIALMMERAGLAPKMDIVDITNLMMTEYGQPMHVFDADKVAGSISVRQAKNSEKIHALNGNEYTLTEADMVIADESGPIAIAWVIGGMESAVTETTKNIIWESACFDATAVRLTAQRHGIRTDASTRYEKSLDPLLAGCTFGRVIEYMKFLRKEVNITGTSSYLDESRVNDITIEVDHDFIDMKAGLKIPKKEARDILERLGFEVSVVPFADVPVIPAKAGIQGIDSVTSTEWREQPETGKETKKTLFSAKIEVSLQNEEENECLSIRVPSWRASKDINIKEDIAEEIARVYGYDRTPLSPLSSSFSIAKKNHEIAFRDTTLDHWKSSNWHEVYGYSFTNASLEAKIGKNDMTDAVGIQNAWNEEYTHMRRSLAPRLFIALAENTKYRDRFGFFEIGKVYSKNTIHTLNDSLLQTIAIKPFSEKKMLAGALIGSSIEMLRADIEGYLMKTLGYIPPVHTGTQSSIYHPGISGSYRLEDDILISFGEVHPSVANAFDLPEHVLYFEADYEMIFARSLDRDTRFQNISRYQTIARELNFVMDTHTPTGDIARIIDAVHPWITEVHVDSVFTDETKIWAGKKSVNFAFTLSNHEATITDEEALSVQNMVIEKMGEKGYNLRG